MHWNYDRFEFISTEYLIDSKYEIEAEENHVKSFIHYSKINNNCLITSK